MNLFGKLRVCSLYVVKRWKAMDRDGRGPDISRLTWGTEFVIVSRLNFWHQRPLPTPLGPAPPPTVSQRAQLQCTHLDFDVESISNPMFLCLGAY